jgi:renalase
MTRTSTPKRTRTDAQAKPQRAAVIGAGIAGAACAVSLQRAGMRVTVFDKSRGVGGRMSTRRATWTDASGTEQSTELDHGAQHFNATHPRFRAVLKRAIRVGCVAEWQPKVHAVWPGADVINSFVAVPHMPALTRHLLAGLPLHMGEQVQRLQRAADGWHLVVHGFETVGPFDHVMLALPPSQAAVLLAGHHDDWANSLSAVPMQACWTLMAVTQDVDWPWDACEPTDGPLAWVARNDRKPGRDVPLGCASWVAHATPTWTEAHLEDDSAAVTQALRTALSRQLPGCEKGGTPIHWLHSSVHRWRYAQAAHLSHEECWWDAALGLGVCGDFMGAGNVEAAWRSGDELADTVAALMEDTNVTEDLKDTAAA